MRTLPLNRGDFSSFSISEVLNHHGLGSLGSWGTFQVDPKWPYMERTEKVTRRWSRCAHKEAGANCCSARLQHGGWRIQQRIHCWIVGTTVSDTWNSFPRGITVRRQEIRDVTRTQFRWFRFHPSAENRLARCIHEGQKNMLAPMDRFKGLQIYRKPMFF